MDEMYTAEKGKGAFLNDRRIRVAARENISDAVTVTGIPHRGKPGRERFLHECREVMQQAVGVRRSGSAAIDLAWTAAGRFDGYWERNLQAWDMAGGIVLVREAGGTVSDADGAFDMLNKGSLVAGNMVVQQQLLKLIKD
jgi:myo-inositol-1(or 4)-monophosphatase